MSPASYSDTENTLNHSARRSVAGLHYRFKASLLGLVLISLAASSGCATVLSERKYPVTFDNPPGPTCFSVIDRKNNVVHQGLTPQQLTLDAKGLPFIPAKYSVVFAGQENTSQVVPLKAGPDPWIIGNILLGGVPGFIVDGATGAMYRLPKKVQGNVPSQMAILNPNAGAQIAQSVVHANGGSKDESKASRVAFAAGNTDGNAEKDNNGIFGTLGNLSNGVQPASATTVK